MRYREVHPNHRLKANESRDGPSFIFPHCGAFSAPSPPKSPPLLQEGVELSLDVVEGVFAHVVHLARFPTLFPLLRGDLRSRRRSRGGCGLLRRVLVKLILRDRVSE